MSGINVWRSAAFVSGIALLVVLSQIDLAGLRQLLRGLDWRLLTLGVCLLSLEAIASSVRLWWLAGRRASILTAIEVNAWYMLYLLLLPARLGELAVVGVLRSRLGQTTGAAAGSIVIQRMFDVVTLATCLALSAAIVASIEASLVVAVGIPLLAGLLVRMESLLTLSARCLRRWSSAPGIRRKLLHLVLQARTWSRRHLDHTTLALMLVLTFLKWAGSLVGLVMILRATGIEFGALELLPVVIVYVFLSIVPLQSLAGVGVTDVGLLAMLVSLGIDSGLGAAITLFCRLTLIVFTAMFAGVVLLPGAFARG